MRYYKKQYEKDFFDDACGRIDNESVKKRMKYLLAWYSQKAEENKRKYNLLRTWSYSLPCIITLVNVFAFLLSKEWIAVISGTISVLLAFINHRMDHHRYYENWIRYRNTVEKLKTQMEYYLSGSFPYNCDDSKMNSRILAEMIESTATEELTRWTNLRSESHNGDKSKPVLAKNKYVFMKTGRKDH